jgi:hypothetical protein
MFYRAILIAGLLAAPAAAQETVDNDQTVYVFPVIPSEEQKKAALLLAYKINGNSMVGNNVMIDLTRPIPVEAVRIPPVEVLKQMPAVEKPAVKVAQVADICQRHGKRRVATHGGRSWRCK